MNYREILSDLKKGIFKPVYFLHGEEPYYIDKLTTYIEGHALDEAGKAFNQIILYGKDIDFKTVNDNARQYPMMAERRVVIVKEAQDLKSLNDLTPYFESPAPQTVLVFAYKYKKVDKRTKMFKALKNQAILFESKRLYDNQLPEWIVSYVSEKGYSIENAATHLLAEYLGTELSRVANEIDKMVVNLDNGGKITVGLVQEQVGISKDYNVFEFQKAIGEGDFLRVNRIINHFSANEKSHPMVMVISSLYNYFYKMYITSANSGLNDNALREKLGLASVFFVKEYKSAAHRYKINRIRAIFTYLLEADKNAKGIDSKSKSYKGILQELVYKIMQTS